MQSGNDKISKLQHSLIHWQKWEAEYEALRDEVRGLVECTVEKLLEIARELDSDLVTAKEIKELITSPNGNSRNISQITDALNWRIEYTQKNVQAVERLLEASKESSESTSTKSNVNEQIEFPLTEIREDLDEEGNILSSATFRPRDEKPQIIESLRKAGLIDPSSEDDAKQQQQANAKSQEKRLPIRTCSKGSDTPNSKATESSGKIEKESHAQATSKKRKKVSFAVAENDEKQASSMKMSNPFKSDVSDFTFKSGSKVLELDDRDKAIRATALLSADESPEEFALRREMLKYSLNEVGSVVAELDLCGDDEFSSLSDGSGSDMEDEHGRRLGGNIPPGYRAQMQELQRKVNQSQYDSGEKNSGVSRVANTGSDKSDGEYISPKPGDDINEPAAKRSQTKAKKSLRFADKVEIHHLPKEDIVSGSTKKPNTKGEMLSARSKSTETSSTPTQELEKGPINTLRATVIERQVKEKPISECNDLGTENLLHEAKANYYDIRNRAIQKQGGFMPTEEEEDNPLMEERNGQVRKVSRFKAARLKPADG